MRFEQEHDPDPIRQSFQEVDSVKDLPGETQLIIGQYYNSLLENINILREASEKNGVSENFPMSLTEDGIIKYNAFMQKQISDLQQSVKSLLKGMNMIRDTINEIAEIVEGELGDDS